MVRLHGRNVQGWQAQRRGEQPTVQEKYDYLYTPEELRGLADTVQRFRGRARWVYTKFNNNNWDYPVQNALGFRQLLGQAVPDLQALRTEYQPPEPRPSRRRRAPLPFLPPEQPRLIDDGTQASTDY